MRSSSFNVSNRKLWGWSFNLSISRDSCFSFIDFCFCLCICKIFSSDELELFDSFMGWRRNELLSSTISRCWLLRVRGILAIGCAVSLCKLMRTLSSTERSGTRVLSVPLLSCLSDLSVIPVCVSIRDFPSRGIIEGCVFLGRMRWNFSNVVNSEFLGVGLMSDFAECLCCGGGFFSFCGRLYTNSLPAKYTVLIVHQEITINRSLGRNPLKTIWKKEKKLTGFYLKFSTCSGTNFIIWPKFLYFAVCK